VFREPDIPSSNSYLIFSFIFSGRQPRKDVKVYRRFRHWLRPDLKRVADGLMGPNTTKQPATRWRWGRSQCLKRRETFTAWHGCLPEKIPLNSVVAKASRLALYCRIGPSKESLPLRDSV